MTYIVKSTRGMSRRQTVVAAIAMAMLAAMLFANAKLAFAQFEDMPPRDVYRERGRTRESQMALCINSAGMMASFEKAVGEQIASRLLLTPKVIEVKTWHPTEPLDYRLPLLFEEVYIEFAERCDGFMGFTLAQHPDGPCRDVAGNPQSGRYPGDSTNRHAHAQRGRQSADCVSSIATGEE